MCAYQSLYKHLTHIFWNIDTLSNYLFFDLPSKTQKKNLKSFQFKKIAQKTLTKLQDCYLPQKVALADWKKVIKFG